VPERRPLSEPAAETEGGREENPDSDGSTFSATLGVWLAALVVLRASHADCRVGGRGETGGPLLRPFEITLAGGVGLLLLREPPLLVLVLVLVLVVCERATLNPSSPSA
jgi:hypothetical protein